LFNSKFWVIPLTITTIFISSRRWPYEKWVLLLTIFCGVILVAGCDQEEEDVDHEEAIKEVVEANLEATENEDIEGIKETMHEESPEYDDAAMEEMELLFEQFDLEYELEIIEVTQENDEATVEFEQETRAEENTEFEDNLLKGFHELRKQEGEWKIYQTQVMDVEPLED